MHLLKFIILGLVLSSCSNTPPKVQHQNYGIVTAEHSAFKADAVECVKMVQNTEPQENPSVLTTTATVAHEVAPSSPLSALVAAMYYGQAIKSKANEAASCLEKRGWSLVK